MAVELIDRLSDISVPFERVLYMGHGAAHLMQHGRMQGTLCMLSGSQGEVMGEEDRLPFADETFDLMINSAGLETVDDLPGALLLARRVLKPGGLFLGALMGAGSLPLLRTCFAHGDAEAGVAAARFHPQIDVRAMGDLLGRAGFSKPVVDQDTVRARYSDFDRLIRDVRANGLSNVLSVNAALPRASAAVAQHHFEAQKDKDERATEVFCPIYLSGWKPERGETPPTGPKGTFFPKPR